MPNQNFALGNIKRVVALDFSDTSNIPDSNIDSLGNFVDENGFFIRSSEDVSLKYCPMGNEDSEFIIKDFAASDIFIDPELCRKIFAVGSPLPENIYIGYGV